MGGNTPEGLSEMGGNVWEGGLSENDGGPPEMRGNTSDGLSGMGGDTSQGGQSEIGGDPPESACDPPLEPVPDGPEPDDDAAPPHDGTWHSPQMLFLRRYLCQLTGVKIMNRTLQPLAAIGAAFRSVRGTKRRLAQARTLR
jgi:hypothetical protein